MKQKYWNQWLALVLGIVTFYGIPHIWIAETYAAGKILSSNRVEILQELAKANIIYLGETHDSLADHKAQLEIIQELYKQNPKIAIALEMFQRPYQSILDQYLAGKISEEELKKQTEYEQRWGFDWEYYAPIFRFAKTHQLPLLALNTPTEITRKVARQGLANLTPEEKLYIPPLEEIKTDDQAYRQRLQKIYEEHTQNGQGNSQDFEKFFTTQVLWDETMAEAIAKFYQSHPQYQIIILAGRGHIVYNYGIPNRVARRLKGLQFVQRSVIMGKSLEEIEFSGNTAIADYFWQH